MKSAILAFAAVMAATTATSQDCRQVESDLDRLACYDLESGRTPPTEGNGWSVSTTIDEMTDEITVTVAKTSDEILPCGANPSHAELVLNCRGFEMGAHIQTSCEMNGYNWRSNSPASDENTVTYRFDSKPALSHYFTTNESHNSIIFWEWGSNADLILNLLEHDRARFRFTPNNEQPMITRFDISGLEDAILQMRETCTFVTRSAR